MNKTVPKIGWVRWTDPYSVNTDDKEENDWDNEDIDIPEYDDDKDYDGSGFIGAQTSQNGPMKVVLTPMGAIPIPEHSAPQKVFNLWVAHTNFNISKEIRQVVEDTEGVETLDVYTRYRMRVGIGKMFSSKDTIRRINQNLYQCLEPVKK